jgi:dienelactone hydrolase
MRIEDIVYEVDGRRMVGLFAMDDLRPGLRPAVLVCHEGPGLEEHAKGRAIRLAGLGYAAFALDYHGDGQVLASDKMMERIGQMMGDPSITRRLAGAGLEVLLSQDGVDPARVAAIGYCFGGAMCLELARSGADVAAIVGFHPGFGPPNPDDSRHITASVLMCVGADDPFVSAEQRRAFEAEMAEAGVADWRLDVYGGVGHSFTNPRVDAAGMPGVAFNAAADRRSWRAMLELFDETLGPL